MDKNKLEKANELLKKGNELNNAIDWFKSHEGDDPTDLFDDLFSKAHLVISGKLLDELTIFAYKSMTDYLNTRISEVIDEFEKLLVCQET